MAAFDAGVKSLVKRLGDNATESQAWHDDMRDAVLQAVRQGFIYSWSKSYNTIVVVDDDDDNNL